MAIEKNQRIKAEDVRQGLTIWDSSLEYQVNATCYYANEDAGIPYTIYRNITGNNASTNPSEDTVNWEALQLGGGGGLEVGDIGISPFVDEGKNLRRLLNGQVISQSQFAGFTVKLKKAVQTYPSLATTESDWQAIKTNSKIGQVGKFVIDDAAGTIRLPCIVRLQGVLDLSNIGNIKDESLPNIKGTFGAEYYMNPSGTGAFVRETRTVGGKDNFNGGGTWSFDASRSSSAYQDNAPVQEEAIQYPYFIQVANGYVEDVNIDVVASKLNTDISNITDADKSLISSLSMPSDSYISLTLSKSGSTYTMTKTGCIALGATFNTDGVVYVYRAKAPRYGASTRYTANQWVDICLNAKKDDVITIQYSGSATVHYFNLIYAEGEK